MAAADGGSASDCHFVFRRWGRVGQEEGTSACRGPFGQLSDAEKEFDTTFRAKTGHTWEAMQQGAFNPVPGKYRLAGRDGEGGEARDR